jgi:DNA polymerase III delta prime subunit
MTQIERITYYEGLMDQIISALDRISPMVRELETYYTSDQWKKDYAADEAGQLPKDLKRGVLSEDGVYNLLERFREG